MKEKLEQYTDAEKQRSKLKAKYKTEYGAAKKEVERLKPLARKKDAPKEVKEQYKKAEQALKKAQHAERNDKDLQNLNKKLSGLTKRAAKSSTEPLVVLGTTMTSPS